MSRRRELSVLVTVLFTDIVGSTEIAAELGDRRWRDLVGRHHAIVRRELKRFRGRELDTAGDGFFARFDRPADAIRCACAVSDEVRELGIEIRAGIHVGEAEVFEHKVGGIAVNVAARVMGVAEGGEVLVSSTLRDAVAGSGFAFADHGTHGLKGIEGEWRLYEVTSVDGERRALPLAEEEARARRGFSEAVPVHRRRDRVLAVAAGALVLAVVGAFLLISALGRDDLPRTRTKELTAAERALAGLVPEGLRPTCARADAAFADATASITCERGPYSVTYGRFAHAGDMQRRFDAFSAAVVTSGGSCATDPSASHDYTINGSPTGEVTCYMEDRRSGLSSAVSVIVWTDEELGVLARAVRGDAADLTLYEWWRTVAGPSSSTVLLEKDGEAEFLDGFFELEIQRGEVGASGTADPSWARSWTVKLSAEDGFAGMPTYEEGGELLFGKPNVLIFDYGSPFPGFGATCPAYQSVTWRIRGNHVVFGDPDGHCRERNLDVLTFAPWRRIA